MRRRQRRGIPPNIWREHIEMTVGSMDTSSIDAQRESRQWDLEYENQRFPPKYVISMANRLANGVELDPLDFKSRDARRYLKMLGFSVVPKNR